MRKSSPSVAVTPLNTLAGVSALSSSGSSSSASPREYLALCRARDGVAVLVATWRARRFRCVYQHLHQQATRIQTWWRGHHGYSTSRTHVVGTAGGNGLEIPLAGSGHALSDVLPLEVTRDAGPMQDDCAVAECTTPPTGTVAITVEEPVGRLACASEGESIQDIDTAEEVEGGDQCEEGEVDSVFSERREPHHLVIAFNTYARTLQRWWRQQLEAREARTRRTRTAARSFLRRAQTEAARAEAEAAALRASRRVAAQRLHSLALMQAWCRGRRVRRNLARARAAVVVLQSRMRGIIARRVVSMLRTAPTNREVVASTVIQAYWRRAAGQWRFLRFRRAIVAVQSRVRRWRACRAMLSALAAARTLQRWYRGCIERRSMRRWQADLADLHGQQVLGDAQSRGRVAVVVLQSWLRGWLVRAASARASIASTRVQLWWRRRHASLLLLSTSQHNGRKHTVASEMLPRPATEYLLDTSPASSVHGQSLSPAWSVVDQFRFLCRARHAVTRIQATMRARPVRLQYLRVYRACVRLQQWWRARALAQQGECG